ncbi:MAG: phosphoribosyltransferase family protein [Bacteroidota bacterium]
MFQAFINLLFPRTCLACQHLLGDQEQHVCMTCLATLPSAELESHARRTSLTEKFYGLLPLQHAFSLYYFSKRGRVQKLLHHLKYHQQTEALHFFGHHLGYKIQQTGHQAHFDLIIPVPLHPDRLQQRGYNQSECFAEGLSQALDIPMNKEILQRDVHTSTQTAKSRKARWKDLTGAFSLQKNLRESLHKKKILLVDDLVTTGATIAASAQPLLSAAPQALSLATLALAV